MCRQELLCSVEHHGHFPDLEAVEKLKITNIMKDKVAANPTAPFITWTLKEKELAHTHRCKETAFVLTSEQTLLFGFNFFLEM